MSSLRPDLRHPGLHPSLPCLLLLSAVCACGGPPPEVCREGQEPRMVAATRVGGAGLHPYGHSHNDYEHRRPLEDALEARFYSVEADVYFRGGRFEVSHLGFFPKGTLESLYLAPLQERVDRLGSVHGDGLPFTLWVDLKDRDAKLVESLAALLDRFPMLAQYQGDAVLASGPVTVVLTGNEEMKEAFVRDMSPRRAVRDSNDYTPEDPVDVPGWGAYALDWGRYLDWDGRGELPPEQRRRLACIVENAHAARRRVRFYAAPDREEVWRLALEVGVDFIHTDRLEALEAFLEGP